MYFFYILRNDPVYVHAANMIVLEACETYKPRSEYVY
jgi:hypothetical protein